MASVELGDCITHREPALQDLPQLLAQLVAGVLDLDVSSLRDNLLGGERPLGVSPSRVGPPLLDGLDILLVALLLLVQVRHGGGNAEGLCM